MKSKSNQTDRRVIRTKREILRALTELLEQKSIDEITVKEITDLAGINRGTFYLHYIDKYDLLEKSVNKIIVEMREISSDILIKASEDNEPDQVKDEIVQSSTKIFEYVQDNHRFIQSLLSVNSSYSFHHKFNGLLKDNLVEKIAHQNMKVPTEYLVMASSYAYEGLIHAWLESDMEESPEQMGEYGFEIIYRLVHGVMNGH